MGVQVRSQWSGVFYLIFAFAIGIGGLALLSMAQELPVTPPIPTLSPVPVISVTPSATPPEEPPLPVIGKFWNTHYYVVLEKKYPPVAESEKIAIHDADGNEIAKTSVAFKKAVDIEGTGRLIDGRVINYAEVKNHEILYHVSAHEFGHGVGNCPLSPFKVIAVDPNQIAIGTTVKIDETVGMLLPDGSHHDGIWYAYDVGGAIKQLHIDLFVGDGNQGSVLRKAGITHRQELTVRKVSGPDHAPFLNCWRETPK